MLFSPQILLRAIASSALPVQALASGERPARLAMQAKATVRRWRRMLAFWR